MIAACEGLDVDLRLVEGLPHDEARKRYEDADIVVDQLNAGWYGLFAIESMALGKPVVTYLHEEAVRRTEEAFGVHVPLVPTTKETLRETLRPLVADAAERRRIGAASRAYVEQVHDARANAQRLLDLYRALPLAAAARTWIDLSGARTLHADRPPGPPSAIYGLGGIISRILAVFLLPLYTAYLDHERLRARSAC